MPNVYKERARPPSWSDFRPMPLHRSLLPFSYTNWVGEWMAYILGKWSIFEVLDYVGSFSILVAVIFYFAESGDRLKTKHYQAWQVINTAQGKGGSGGRIDALQELNEDGVPLVGVDLTDAYLQGMRLVDANLHRADFGSADLRNAQLDDCNLQSAAFLSTNMRTSDCSKSNFTDANFTDADLNGASLRKVKMQGAIFDRVDLRNVDLADVTDWNAIQSIKLADVHGVKNNDDFVAWAKSHGAVDIADDDAWNKLIGQQPITQPTR
jgi:hypothetical protein